MKIIEFNGLSGCGKTTLSKAVEESLSGCKILTRSVFSTHRKKILNSSHLQFLLDFLNLKNLKINILITLFAFSYKVNKARIERILAFVIFTAELNKRIKENEGCYLILDQGILNLLASIPHEYYLKENYIFKKLMKDLQKRYSNMLFIDCNLQKRDVRQRIRKRNKKDHNFDSLPDDLLDTMLDIKKMNLEIIRDYFEERAKVLTVDMSSEKEKNVKRIIDFIQN